MTLSKLNMLLLLTHPSCFGLSGCRDGNNIPSYREVNSDREQTASYKGKL